MIEAGSVSPLIQLLKNAEFKIKKDAARAILNAIAGETREQIKYNSVAIFMYIVGYFAFRSDFNASI